MEIFDLMENFADCRDRQAGSPHHQIGFGFVSDGAKVFAKVKKSTNTERAMLSMQKFSETKKLK